MPRPPYQWSLGGARGQRGLRTVGANGGSTMVPGAKMIFFAPGTPVDPPLAPTAHGPSCPPAPPSDHWYRGLGVSLGDSVGWKPQKVGGCGWARCPWNSDLSHVAQDTARSWFWAYLTQTAHIQAIFSHFWAVSRTYRAIRGQQRALCHGAIEELVECSKLFPFICPFGVGFGTVLGKKKAILGRKMRSFGRAPPDLAPLPRGTTGDFFAQNLDLARPPPRL